MKYYEYTFCTSPTSETTNDVLSAMLCDENFETFFTDEDGQLHAFVQQNLYEEGAVENLIKDYPLPEVQITFKVSEPEDRDWNETWETEGFEPIYVDDKLVVCDTRHVVDPRFKQILIHPRQAFGTGSHQTTRMILSTILQLPLENKKVIDAGCGTGILGFLCLMQNAARVWAYDIDEWSVQNTLDNAELNGLTGKISVHHGDATVLSQVSEYDLLIANINRNILLGDMERFSNALASKAQLLLSGFYQEDVPYLLESASQFGFKLVKQRNDEEWAMLLFER